MNAKTYTVRWNGLGRVGGVMLWEHCATVTVRPEVLPEVLAGLASVACTRAVAVAICQASGQAVYYDAEGVGLTGDPPP